MTKVTKYPCHLESPSYAEASPYEIPHSLVKVDDVREYSELSGIFLEDGLAVDVKIYKVPDQLGWFLETQDGSTAPIRWSKRFASDLAAWNEFQRIVKEESMEAVAGAMRTTNR